MKNTNSLKQFIIKNQLMKNTNNLRINKVFEISHYNFGLIGPGCWNHTIWKIYDDYSIIKCDYYNGKTGKELEIVQTEQNMTISEQTFNELKKLFELAQTVNDKVNAYDGDAWGFSYYVGNNLIWRRNVSYIYGINVFEEITKLINKLN